MSDVDQIKKYLDSIGPANQPKMLTESSETVLREEDAAMIADELSEIKEQIKQLTYEAMELVPRDAASHGRAKSYWFPQILQALDGESEYMGSSMHSMQDTIEELEAEGAPYDQGGFEYQDPDNPHERTDRR